MGNNSFKNNYEMDSMLIVYQHTNLNQADVIHQLLVLNFFTIKYFEFLEENIFLLDILYKDVIIFIHILGTIHYIQEYHLIKFCLQLLNNMQVNNSHFFKLLHTFHLYSNY